MALGNGGVEVFSPTGDRVVSPAVRSSFMTRVYGWMVAGLGVSTATAIATVASPTLSSLASRGYLFLVLAQFGLVIALSALARKLSGPLAAVLFLAYSALTGVTLSFIFFAYNLGTIATAFAVTAGTFLALTAYGTFTKKDLSAWSTFLFMGLFGVIIASVVNIFMASDMMAFVITCATVLVFAGLTAYDTQKLRSLQASGVGNEGALAVNGALILYLDFINLFLSILNLLGRRR